MRLSGRERVLILVLVGVIGTIGAVAGHLKWSSTQVLSDKVQAREQIEGLENAKRVARQLSVLRHLTLHDDGAHPRLGPQSNAVLVGR